MSTADQDFEKVSELIARTRAQGWGVAFDQNRHQQWRVSRVVNYQNYPLVADTDFETACRLALDEVERLLDPPQMQTPNSYGDPHIELIQSQQPELAAPHGWDGHTSD